MDDTRRAEIEALLSKATPGPWKWVHDAYNEQPRFDGTKKRRKGELYVMLLQGQPEYPLPSGRIDPYDNAVVSLSWAFIKGSVIPHPVHGPFENAQLIEQAPSIIRELLAEIDRLNAIIDPPFQDVQFDTIDMVAFSDGSVWIDGDAINAELVDKPIFTGPDVVASSKPMTIAEYEAWLAEQHLPADVDQPEAEQQRHPEDGDLKQQEDR